MVTIMTEQKAMAAMRKRDTNLDDLKHEIQKAKLTILGAEKQLEIGSIPFSALEDLEKLYRSMYKLAGTAEMYDNMGRFLSDLRSIA